LALKEGATGRLEWIGLAMVCGWQCITDNVGRGHDEGYKEDGGDGF